MFESLLIMVRLLLATLSSAGVKVKKIGFVGVDYIEVIFDNRDDYPSVLEIANDADVPKKINFTVSVADEEGDYMYRELSFMRDSGMCNDDVVLAFVTLIDIDKLKPAPVEIVAPVKEDYHFFFTKLCRKCNDVYFRNEITKDAFENQLGNDNIDVIYDDHYNRRIQLISVCAKCSS